VPSAAGPVAGDFGDGLIAEEVGELWEDWMRHVDSVLDDPRLLDAAYQALARRWTNSRTCGRRGTPVDAWCACLS
jgi:IS5 family transposase